MNHGVRVLITDNVVSNMGDAAILLAMKSSLEEAFGPDTEVRNCYCGVTQEPGPYSELYPELHFTSTLWDAAYDRTTPKWNLWARLIRKTAAARFPMQARLRMVGFPLFLLTSRERRLFREFEEADIVIGSGGAVLTTSWTSARLRKARVAQYHVALTLGKPFCLYAHSIGPFRDGDNLPELLREPLGRASAVLCRDADSLRVARNIVKLDGDNVHLTIDEALKLVPRAPAAALAPDKKMPLRIGVCVHHYIWPGDANPESAQGAFEGRIARVCQALLDRGDVELVFLTSHQDMPGSFQNDEPVCRRIEEQLSLEAGGVVHHIGGFVHPREFSHFMGACDLVLSSRLHGAILSLVGGAPVVVLGYEPKSLGLMRQIGLEDWVLSMSDARPVEIIAKVTEMLSDLPSTADRARGALLKGQKLAQRNIEIVVAAVQAHWKKSGREIPSARRAAELRP